MKFNSIIRKLLVLVVVCSSRLSYSQCPLTFYTGIGVANSGTNFATWSNFGPGQYFAWPVLNGGSYALSTCGSGVCTQLTGYDNSASSVVFINTGFGPLCSGSCNASINNFVPNFTGYSYVQVTQYYCGAGGSSSINLYLRQNDNLAFTSSSGAMCSGQTRVLTATPGNVGSTPGGWGDPGTFSGVGVSGNVFTAPNVASATNYTITYTFGYVSKTQVITVYPNPTLTFSSSNVSCNGGSDGSATANPASGVAPYTYLWSTGGTNQSITSLNAGSRSVTVTATGGCIVTGNITITQPSAISTGTGITNPLCNGANGSATLTTSGGTSPYTYTWSSGPTTSVEPTLIAGTYSVRVTDANGCNVTRSVTITQPSAVNTTTSVTNINCFGNSTGSASITASGGTGGYSYLWSTGATTSVITGLNTGVRTATVTDANGCTSSNSVSITQPASALASSTNALNVLCNGNSTGAATIIASGGNSPYTYLWSSGATSTVISGLNSGVRTVTVTDANNCTTTNTVTISQPSALNTSTSVTNVLCFGNSTGGATITATGGAGGYGYLWSNGATTAGISSLPAGVFTATVTDANGCTNSKSSTITQPSALSTSTVVSNVLCNGNSNGSTTLTTSGGTSPYSYLWSSGATTSVITGLNAGVRTVTITDANNCVGFNTVTVNQPSALNTATTVLNVLCFGNSTGAATVTASGGTAPYSYLWSSAATTSVISSLIAGARTVTVTDANGCVASDAVSVSQPASGLSTATAVVNVLCNGNSTGAATVTASGGTAPYTYLWSSAATTSVITGLIAGPRTVTVTDANSCTNSNSVDITQPTALSSATLVSNVLCFGGSTGAATVTASGGVAPYSYLWSSAQTTSVINALNIGVRTVTVTDANSCSISNTVSVSQPAAALSTATTVLNVLCFGNSTGAATVTASGGTAPYSYLWSSAATTSVISSLIAGVRTVTVTDANGCVASDVVSVSQPVSGLSTATAVVNVLCNGNSTGAATVTASGGTAPYTYLWSSAATTSVITGLIAGPRTVTVTDANSCTNSNSVDVTQPTALSSATLVSNVLCFGGSTGAATVTASGGVAPYSYLWSSAQTTSVINALNIGVRTVTVTDANSCSISNTVSVSQPAAALSTATTVLNVLCFGNSTGAATVTASGGTAPYSYLWSSAATTSVISSLIAGARTVTVTDANGCVASDAVSVSQPASGLSTATAVVNVLCNGNSTGAATVTASGGTAPYTYLWSSAATTSVITGLIAGPRTVTVTDANSCTNSNSVDITQPTALSSATLVSNVLCFGGSTGAATVTASGGVAPYSYLWSSAQTTSVINALNIGVRTVTVTDANSCSISNTVSVSQPAAALSTATTVLNVLCFGNSTGAATVTASGGTAPYSYLWSSAATTSVISSLIAGVRTVTVTDANGCVASDVVSVSQPVSGLSTATAVVNVLCNGNSTGAATVTASGGTAPYTYLWSSAATTSVITGLIAGPRTVTVTDANSCTNSNSVDITQPTALSSATLVSNVLCFGGSTGAATVTASGGVAPYSYLWSSAQTTSVINALNIGVRTVTVTDANSCSISNTVSVSQPAAALSTATTVLNVLCFGNSTGAATVTASGGTAPYSYLWSSAATTSVISSLIAGVRTVTVTDANGCVASDVVSVSQPVSGLSTATAVVNVLCNGNSTGAATVTASGGTAPYTYLWSSAATTSVITGLIAGPRTVTVTDANSCTNSNSVDVTQPTALSSATLVSNVLCFGGSTGAATVTASGGVAPYSYLWSSAQTTSVINALNIGVRTVTVTDANSCSISNTVSVSQPAAALSTATTVLNVLCFGNSTGAATVTASGGTAPYSYLWSSAATTSVISSLIAGARTVTVTDANGCVASDAVSVSQPASGLSTATAVVNVLCNGNSTGAATVTASGGTAPYTYLWSSAATTSVITGLIAGPRTVTVTDANSCTNSNSVDITQPTALSSATLVSNVLCFGGSTGAATVTASGGVAPYSYLWSSAQTTSVINALNIGVRTVTVTDANSCSISNTVSVSQPAAALSTATTVLNVLCFGNSTGAATVTASGGTAPYSYLWSSAATTSVISSLIAGVRTVTVTDANGCVASDVVSVSQPVSGLSTATAVVNVLCNGNSTGAATVTASGGTAPYTYLWSSAATTSVITGLIAGPRTVTVTDANSCTNSNSVDITQPTALSSATLVSNVLCFGGSTGAATVTASGGVAPYSYLWSSAQTTSVINALNIGVRTVTVTDANSCSISNTVSVSQPAAALSTATTVLNVLCFGNSTGAATVTASGGTAPYSYLWSSAATTSVISSLIAGVRTVTVTDANGCVASDVVSVSQPVSGLSTATAVVNVLCNGNSTGAATVTASGGTAPYTYLWSSAATTSVITGLIAGPRTVTVTDANSCTNSNSVDVTQPTALSSATLVSNVLCFGGSTGAATVTASGGVAPYSYLWSSAQTTSVINALNIGVRTVTVTDANSCSISNTVSVSQPAAALSTATTVLNVLCFGNSTGAATVTASGGTAPYSYLWSSAATTSVISSLIAGARTVTVTDANGCVASDAVSVSQPASGLSTATAVVNVLCNGNSTGAATVTASGGTAPYTYLWSSAATTSVITGLIAGPRTVTVTDANGCTSSNSVDITQPSALSVSISANSSTVCFGSSITLIASANGGAGIISYSWVSGPNSNSITVSPTVNTTYTVDVSDANGCQISANETISVIAQPTISANTSNSIICFGGTITLNGSGASSYTWTSSNGINPQDGVVFTPSTNANYSVSGTSSVGCISSNTAVIAVTVNPLPTLNVISTKSIICFGDSTYLTSTGALTYTWNPSFINGTSVKPIASQIYSLQATDNNGCVNNTTYSVLVNSLPSLTLSSSIPESCSLQSTTLSVAGALTYTWMGAAASSSLVVSPTVLTTYSVMGTDLNGCTNTGIITQSVIPCSPQTKVLITYTPVSCSGKNDGKIVAQPTLEAYPFETEFIWRSSNVFKNRNEGFIDSLKAGKYELSIVFTYTAENNFVKKDTLEADVTTIVDINPPCDLTVFTGISPNNDGVNDQWVITNIQLFPKNKVTIYNRWGVLMAQIEGYDNNTKVWPDKNSINKLDATTYYYVIDQGDGSKPIKGWIELMK